MKYLTGHFTWKVYTLCGRFLSIQYVAQKGCEFQCSFSICLRIYTPRGRVAVNLPQRCVGFKWSSLVGECRRKIEINHHLDPIFICILNNLYSPGMFGIGALLLIEGNCEVFCQCLEPCTTIPLSIRRVAVSYFNWLKKFKSPKNLGNFHQIKKYMKCLNSFFFFFFFLFCFVFQWNIKLQYLFDAVAILLK